MIPPYAHLRKDKKNKKKIPHFYAIIAVKLRNRGSMQYPWVLEKKSFSGKFPTILGRRDNARGAEKKGVFIIQCTASVA